MLPFLIRIILIGALGAASLAVAAPYKRRTAPPLTVVDAALAALSKNKADKYRAHKPTLDLNRLTPGRDIWVDPVVFKNFPSVKGRWTSRIKTRVVAIKKGAPRNARYVFKDDTWLAYLETPDRKVYAVWIPLLVGNAYDAAEVPDQVPFVEDEWLQIGGDYAKENVYHQAEDLNHTVTVQGDPAASWMGRFVRGAGPDHYVVAMKFQDVAHPVLTRIPRDKAYGYPSGTAARFRERLRPLLDTEIEFTRDEVVRYRGADGAVRVGTFVRTDDRYVTVRTENGLEYVSAQSVFRYHRGEPFTAIFNADWILLDFEKPTGSVRRLLDAAGKLSSLPGFGELSDEAQVLAMVKFINVMMPWTFSSNVAQTVCPRGFQDLVEAGAGLCRHHAPILATLLNELGFAARVVKYLESDAVQGHAWVEVELRRTDGRVDTFVVDPNDGNFVGGHGGVFARAAKEPTSMAAQYYAKPNCEYLISPGRPTPDLSH